MKNLYLITKIVLISVVCKGQSVSQNHCKDNQQLVYNGSTENVYPLTPYLITLAGDSIPFTEEKKVPSQKPLQLKYNYNELSIEVEIETLNPSKKLLNLDLFDVKGNQIGSWNFRLQQGSKDFKRVLYTGYLSKGTYHAYATQENEIHTGKIMVSSY